MGSGEQRGDGDRAGQPDPEDDTDGEDTERSTKEEDAAIAYAAILDETVDADEEERDRAEGRKDSSYSG